MKFILKYWWLILIVLILLKLKKTSQKRTILKFGDKGEDVKRLQSWVIKKGYDISLDGIFGEQTSITAYSAMLDFKKDFEKQHKIEYTWDMIDIGGMDFAGLKSVNLDWLLTDDYN